MPPEAHRDRADRVAEPTLESVSRETLSLWQDLRRAYDAIEHALASPDAPPRDGRPQPEELDLGVLGTRIVAIEATLRPLLDDLAARRSRLAGADAGADLYALWRQTDAVVASLAERQPALVRAALAARSAAADRLAASRDARAQIGSYVAADARAVTLTSRHA